MYYVHRLRPSGGSNVYGYVGETSEHPGTNLTTVVYQCVGTTSRGVLAASHSNPTSHKPVAGGHYYRTCASFDNYAGQHIVNYCDDFVAVPT